MTRAGLAPQVTRTLSSRTVYTGAGLILAAVALGCWIPVLIQEPEVPLPHPPLYAGLILAVAFVAGELLPVRFAVNGENHLVSLSELPLAVGILLLPPWIVGVAYLVSSLLVFLLRRDTWRGTVMNLVLIAVESGVAVGVVQLLGDPSGGGDVLTATEGRYLPVALGVLAGALISVMAVGMSQRLTGSGEGLSRVVARSMLTAGVVVTLALVGFTVWSAIDAGPVLCLALALAGVLAYRSYSHFMRQHTDLTQLYSFGAKVADAGGEPDAWQTLAGQVRDQLGARMATLYLTDRPVGSRMLMVSAEDGVHASTLSADDPLLAAARRNGVVRQARDRAVDQAMLAALDARGADDVIVAALRSSDRDRGYVEVCDSRVRWGRFTDDDVTLLQALSGHLATALDNHRLMQRLQYEAHHDPITGLYNRTGLQHRGRELANADGCAGVVLLELQALDEVNSALGFDRGEQLLALAGQRLAEAAGPDASVGRIDADGFAVLLAPQSEESAREWAAGIVRALGAPIEVGGLEIEPTVAAGIGLTGPPGAVGISEDMLLQHARLALQTARSKGEQLAVYRPAMGEVYQRRFQLVSQFRHAVDSGRVVVHYQPKLTLGDRELIGVEALVRWMHPEYGFVSPAELIEAIEGTSAIDVLFQHVLHQALAQVVDWLARGMRIAVAVNLSVRNLLAPNFTATVTDALQRYQVPPDMLTLEITESSVMEQPERTLPILREMHATGIRLSVDDFGTGYSSLAYLRRLPIDEIKIDKSFVQGMVTDLGDLAIVRAIIDLGHSLGLRVVAEGVEEEAGRDALRSMRCDAMQGFLLARPLPLDRFESWLRSRTVAEETASQDSPMPLRMRL